MEEGESIEEITKLIEKWRDILYINKVWNITICLEEMDCVGALDISSAEYYKADLIINENIINDLNKVEELIVHEFVHLVMVDFMRTGLLFAKTKSEKKELGYKYEQLTTKISRIIKDLYER